MLPHRLRSSLFVAQMVSALTLIRSIMFDRWITVLVSALLIGGAAAAMRGKTWGIGLALAMSFWFHAASVIGIAPPWFVFVGMVGSMPFIHLLPSFARFDRKATALLGLIAAAVGSVGAVAWKATAVSVFAHVPLLRPSVYPHHGLLLALLGTVLFANRARLVDAWEGDAESVARSDAERVRIGAESPTVRIEDATLEDALEEHASSPPAQMRR